MEWGDCDWFTWGLVRPRGNRKMEATRGKAKRRTKKIKMTYGTILKKTGVKS